jgi:2-phosphosulfolactate phosphatase
MKISVYHTPELTPAVNTADCSIVIDVLRATTTMVTALSVGAEAVQVFSDLDALMQVSDRWDDTKRIRAGERGGSKVAGFDFGNSPLDCTEEGMAGKRLFVSTTNGTRAFQRVEDSPIVLGAALINRDVVVNFLMEKQPETIWIVAAGWEGSYALEDTVCAGAIVDSLAEKMGVSLEDLAGNDEIVGAVTLYRQWKHDLLGLFKLATHGQRLLRLDAHTDLKYCSELDTVNTLPIQVEKSVLKKAS